MRLAVVLALGACSYEPLRVGPATHDDAPPDLDAPIIAPSTCLGAWCRRIPLVIAGSDVTDGPHTAFPVLVALASAELATHARSDGFDLLFTAADGVTQLDYERVTFDEATGALVAWVKATVTSTVSTRIYLYYANPAATDQQRATSTWDSYAGVWHLEETAGGTAAILDATTNANHGTDVNGAVLGEPGAVGNAVRFDGTNDRIRIVDSPSLDATAAAGTVEAWINFTDPSNGQFQFVLAHSSWPNSFEWASQPGGNHYFYPWRGDVNDFNLGAGLFTNGAWHHAAVTYQMSDRSVAIYVDGTAMSFSTTNVPTLWTTVAAPADWLWGGSPSVANSHFAGRLDEIRVSSVVRTAGWLATAHRNQRTPSTFAVPGAVEMLEP